MQVSFSSTVLLLTCCITDLMNMCRHPVQVLFYNTVVRLLKAVGADSLFAWITPRLETGYATLSGAVPKM